MKTFLGGTTAHSAFNIKFGGQYVPLKSKTLDELRNTLQDLELVIIDEISMITADMLYLIHQRLCEIFVSDDYFGGKMVMLVGDIMQLKPPKNGKFIFDEPKNEKYKPFYETDDLWSAFDVAILDTNHRQGEGNFWTEMLNRFRMGIVLEEDKQKLETRRLKNFPDMNTDGARHAFYTNKEVNIHNQKILNTIDTQLFQVYARVQGPKGYIPQIKNGMYKDTNLMEVLEFKIGSRVMLVKNLDISDSLVNGARGNVVDVKEENGIIKAIMVDFDYPECGIQRRRSSNIFCPGVPIFLDDHEFNLPKKRGNRSHHCTAKIFQFPLRLADAATAHKWQGVTNKKGNKFVCHGHKRMPPAMAYVMMSRCADFDDLYIDNDFDFEKIQCNHEAFEEHEKMKNRSIIPNFLSEHYDFFALNINRLIPHLDDLENDFYVKRSKIVGVIETWIKPGSEAAISSPLGNFYGASAGSGKGVGAFSFSKEKDVIPVIGNNFQILCIPLNEEVQLCLVYLSHNCERGDVVSEFDSILKGNKAYIFAGDFNFHAGEKHIVADFLSRKGYSQLIQTPTHNRGRIIDHLYVHESLINHINFKLHYPYYSDHAAILLKFQ